MVLLLCGGGCYQAKQRRHFGSDSCVVCGRCGVFVPQAVTLYPCRPECDSRIRCTRRLFPEVAGMLGPEYIMQLRLKVSGVQVHIVCPRSLVVVGCLMHSRQPSDVCPMAPGMLSGVVRGEHGARLG